MADPIFELMTVFDWQVLSAGEIVAEFWAQKFRDGHVIIMRRSTRYVMYWDLARRECSIWTWLSFRWQYELRRCADSEK